MFITRFHQYLNERFPPLQHGLLIATFSFSALGYSLICRGKNFIPWTDFAAGVGVIIGIFYLLRVADEHKDAAEDRLNRPHLPVPRGLVSLRELRGTAIAVLALQIGVIGWFFPQLYALHFAILGYLALMTVEFGVPKWLQARPLFYVTSHMLIIPLVDLFASGLDWRLAGAAAPAQMGWFFALSFFNGLVLEVGRKLRAPANEEPNTYSYQFGAARASALFFGVLCATVCLALATVYAAGLPLRYGAWLFVFVPVAAALIRSYLKNQTTASAKRLEILSGVWTLAMYLSVGGAPFLFHEIA